MQRPKHTGCLSEPVIIPPAPEIEIQIIDNLMNRLSAVAVSQLPHPILKSLKRFRMDTDARVTAFAGEAEAEKAHPPRMGDLAFLFVHLQPQFLGDKAGDASHHPGRRPLAADKDEKVVRVANGVQFAVFELFIEFVEYNIGKQRRKWPLLMQRK